MSHAPADRFGLYVIDRYGNREMLYLDPAIGSMCPTPAAAAVPRPAVAGPPLGDVTVADGTRRCRRADEPGQFTWPTFTAAWSPAVRRGTVKYLRVCQELRSGPGAAARRPVPQGPRAVPGLLRRADAQVRGPYGWPSLRGQGLAGHRAGRGGRLGQFLRPGGQGALLRGAGRRFQRGAADAERGAAAAGRDSGAASAATRPDRAPPVRPAIALRRRAAAGSSRRPGAPCRSPTRRSSSPSGTPAASAATTPSDKQKIDLSGALDARARSPPRTARLISQGWVHYFDMTWGREHPKAEPLSFGTVKSRLWKVLDAGHYGVRLSRDERHRVKCWIDLNCPLWPDYRFRLDRPATAAK